MATRPEPVTDLNWDHERAQAFGARVVDLWAEWLERLPDLPVTRDFEPAAIYTSQSAGCVLLRDFGALSRSFHSDASYVWLDEAARRGVDFAMHGPEFSRGFTALKVWISLLAHGTAAYARRIAHDARLAGYLGELVEAHPDFELMVPPRLSICCFRYRPRGFPGGEPELDRLNERLMTAIHSDGRVYCSNAVIDGRFGLRACIVNFRTEAADVEKLLAVASELGRLEGRRGLRPPPAARRGRAAP